MAENKKLLNLAKGGPKNAPPAKKTGASKPKKEEVVVLTPEEQRDLKAKAKVKELLEGVSLTPKKEEEVELLEISREEQQSTEWLQEQVAALSSENQLLKADLTAAKDDYQKIFTENQQLRAGTGVHDDGALKTNVLTIFHEIQSNYLKNPGLRPDGLSNFQIVPPAFLNRMIMFFPFLQEHKRF